MLKPKKKIKIDPNRYSQVKYNKDGTSLKFKTISKKKFDRKSSRYSKQEGSETSGTKKSSAQQVIAGRKSVSRVDIKKRKENLAKLALQRKKRLTAAGKPTGNKAKLALKRKETLAKLALKRKKVKTRKY
tara:strand:- start:216 stop:605 length:390 start_codon:yes stop_codon:yes gene_type:complete